MRSAETIAGLVGTLLVAGSFAAHGQELAVSNPLSVDRTQEIVDVPYATAEKAAGAGASKFIVATDVQTDTPLPSQMYEDSTKTPSKRLLVLVQLHAHQKLRIKLSASDTAASVEPLVFGREAPERKDDFAWENKYVTYRIYGPALQATGEITSGIDIWSKRVPNFVIDSFYKRDSTGQRTHNPALSYHKDNGQGLDSYEVGKTRGCGGTAVYSDGKLLVSDNYTGLKMLSSGPIRFSFEVGYAPWDGGGVQVTEKKRITLDAGSRMNQIDSTWTFAGGKTIDVAAGLAARPGSNPHLVEKGDALSVWDTPQTATAGRIATGMVATQHHWALVADGHALMVFPIHGGTTIRYAAGSGWSKADMPTQDDWDKYLQLYLAQQQHPLTVKWTGQKKNDRSSS